MNISAHDIFRCITWRPDSGAYVRHSCLTCAKDVLGRVSQEWLTYVGQGCLTSGAARRSPPWYVRHSCLTRSARNGRLTVVSLYISALSCKEISNFFTYTDPYVNFFHMSTMGGLLT